MHHYKIAQEAIAAAVSRAEENGWKEEEILQSLVVAAIERHAGVSDAATTRSMLEFEISNLSGTVDFDFVRSR
ncbi:MAG: hypothetical protein R3190_14105 [Thermoanaerobaculia bacterium]|nr:hypothetical protein [Thermoanaerobaculia bacterium]